MPEKDNIIFLIIRYLEKEITEEELKELNKWLEVSPGNKTVFFQLKDIYHSSSETFPEKQVDIQESWNQIYERLRSVNSYDINSSYLRFTYSAFIKYAAVIVIALVVGWLGKKYYDGGDYYNKIFIHREISIYGNGEENKVLLADGSTVYLNTGTKLIYPEVFDKKIREVTLDGEAWFEVSKDEKRPFVVKLKNQSITVLGTSFNVNAYSKELYSRITLVTGSIDVETYDEKGVPVEYISLQPNQCVIANNISGVASVEETEGVLSKSWMNRQYKFKDESIGAILEKLEKYYGVKFYLEDESISSIRYTGTFSLDQDIEEILGVINEGNKFFIRKQIEAYFITSR